jgi:hypothetical protein
MEGLTQTWAASTPALPNAGAMELAATGTAPMPRALVGGPDWAESGAIEPDRGLNWTMTGDTIPAGQAAGPGTQAMLDDWRNLFNPQSPTFWLALSLLAVVGLLHIRLHTNLGPAGFSGHVG